MTGPLSHTSQPDDADTAWRAERLAEARAVIADIVHHSDALIRFACKVLIQHGQNSEEREEARLLLLILEARQPVRSGGSHHEP